MATYSLKVQKGFDPAALILAFKNKIIFCRQENSNFNAALERDKEGDSDTMSAFTIFFNAELSDSDEVILKGYLKRQGDFELNHLAFCA